MSEKRYSTDEIQYQIQVCGDNLGSNTPYWPITEEIYDAIIRKLRAADALVSEAVWADKFLKRVGYWASDVERKGLRKAITDYEEA